MWNHFIIYIYFFMKILRISLAGILTSLCLFTVVPSPAHAASPLIVYPYTISSGNPGTSTATITFTSNIAGTSSISYGPTTAYGTGAFSAISTTNHSIPLISLSPNTTYHYQITSYDAAGDIATSADQTLTTVVSCTYYVDSVNGSDANPGNDPNLAYQHLATVPAVANGSTVCLRRGSTFTDSLYIGVSGDTRNNVTVEDYGPANLPKPMIDESDVIPPGSWSLVAGTSNLYQATVSGPGTSTPSKYLFPFYITGPWINVWECKSSPCTPTGFGGNDWFLYNQTTQALASSTPGSYYISDMTQPTVTIYVHPWDGTNPITNGYTYSYSHRGLGVETDGTNDIVTNIVSKKNADNDGSIVSYGTTGTFNGVEAYQGGKHNVYCSSGCTANNSIFSDAYYYTGSNMFVEFAATALGIPVSCNNCQFYTGTSSNAAIFTSHANSGFDPVSFNGGFAVGVGSNFGSLAGLSSAVNVLGFTCFNTYGCINSDGNLGTTTVLNSQLVNKIFNGTQDGFVDVVGGSAATSSVTIIGNSMTCSGFQHGSINVNQPYSQVTVSSSTLYNSGAGNNAQGIYTNGATNSVITLWNTIIDSISNASYWFLSNQATSTTQYIGDYNAFILPHVSQASILSNYFNLSSWQASTGQDLHTVTSGGTALGNNTATSTGACTPSSMIMTGPTSGSVNASSTSFTLTPNKTFTGTTTISFAGTGSAGLTPFDVTWNNSSSPKTFTIKPTATGTITVTPFINSATTSPAFILATSSSSIYGAPLSQIMLNYQSNSYAPSAPYGTPSATAGNTTATISWNAPADNGGSTVTSYTVASSPGGIATTTTGQSATLIGLTNGTTYTFTVIATNAVGTSASSTSSNSVTPANYASVTTSAATSITTTGATLNGSITATNGSNATDSGFIYSVSPTLSSGVATSSLGAQTGTTTLTTLLTGLSPSTTYYFTIYDTNVVGTVYGTTLSFTTSAVPVVITPTGTISSGGGSQASAAQLALILAPGPATTAYLNSLRLQQGLAPLSTTPASSPAVSSSAFTSNLVTGEVNSEVKSLQIYLNTHGYTIATEGPGSLGNETTKFGTLTKQALMKFQKDHKLPSTGFFGPMTRGVING